MATEQKTEQGAQSNFLTNLKKDLRDRVQEIEQVLIPDIDDSINHAEQKHREWMQEREEEKEKLEAELGQVQRALQDIE